MGDPLLPLASGSLVEFHGSQIRLGSSDVEGMAFMVRSRQSPNLITAADRNPAVAKAREWNDLPLASDRTPE
jgi:hypothetical protein